jgi:hypothetical protein
MWLNLVKSLLLLNERSTLGTSSVFAQRSVLGFNLTLWNAALNETQCPDSLTGASRSQALNMLLHRDSPEIGIARIPRKPVLNKG